MADIKIEEKAEQLLKPIAENEHLEIIDVEFVKEGSNRYLRGYLDKEGGITIDDCEKTSRAWEEALDRADFIAEAYILEVSSPGLTRALKKERDFERNLGKPVEVHTYKPIDSFKEFIGDLMSYDSEKIVLNVGIDKEEPVELNRKDISVIRQYVEW